MPTAGDEHKNVPYWHLILILCVVRGNKEYVILDFRYFLHIRIQ